MENMQTLIDKMLKDKKLVIRNQQNLSWGDQEVCESLFTSLFRRLDKTIAVYEHLPEYAEIITWMTYTCSKGLMLIGDCGRGKSIITTCIIPVLLATKNITSYPVHADDFEKPYPFAANTIGMDPKSSNLDYLIKCPCPVIDELGTEKLINKYGEKYEGFNSIINAAERYYRPMFISTNLTTEQLLNRYGERTLDRLQHLCRIVEFKGDSLR